MIINIQRCSATFSNVQRNQINIPTDSDPAIEKSGCYCHTESYTPPIIRELVGNHYNFTAHSMGVRAFQKLTIQYSLQQRSFDVSL